MNTEYLPTVMKTNASIFPFLTCIPLPLAHTYFIFFLFSHVFSYLWHIPNP